MGMKIRAAVLKASGLERPYARTRPLHIEEVMLDPPGRGEVLIRVRAAGLCHSDLSVIDGNRPRPVPMVLGHEAAGEVVELGEGVTAFAVGDHVVTSFVPSCGHCEPCAMDRPALCEPALASNSAGTLLCGERRLHVREPGAASTIQGAAAASTARAAGSAIHHHLGVSAFAEYAVVAQNSLVKIDADLPFEQAAVFGCAVITGVGAVVNTANVPRGASVAVIGLGGVGLAALLGARRLQAAPLVAIDLSDDKLAIARELGATHTFNAGSATCIADIKKATRGGVAFAFEMAGSTRAMELAYQITRRGGTTVTAGLPHPQSQLSVPHVSIVAEERTIKGSYLGSCIPARDIPRYIGWYKAGELPVERLLSETLRLGDINEAFDRLAEGRTIRQVVTF